MNIFEFVNNLPSKAQFNVLKMEAVEIAGPDITAIVVEQQVKGKDSEDRNITPELSSQYYAKTKKRKGGEASLGTPDIRNSGDTHQTMELFTKGSKYDFFAQTSYFGKLKKNYKKAFAVSKRNMSEAYKFTTPILAKLLKDFKK